MLDYYLLEPKCRAAMTAINKTRASPVHTVGTQVAAVLRYRTRSCVDPYIVRVRQY